MILKIKFLPAKALKKEFQLITNKILIEPPLKVYLEIKHLNTISNSNLKLKKLSFKIEIIFNIIIFKILLIFQKL
jgi:hypothetical protein